MKHLAPRSVAALGPAEMLRRLQAVLYSVPKRLTSEEIDVMLLEFCMNCPDPAGAMGVVLEAPRGATPESVLQEALALEARNPATYSEAELSLDHPLRKWRVQLRAV